MPPAGGSLQQAFATAVGHLRAGRLAEADAAGRKVLAAQPDHPDVLSLLGIVAGHRGRFTEAADLFRRCVARAPGNAGAHANLGRALKELGRTDEALAAYRRALEIRPGVADVHYSLGNLHRETGQLEEAVDAYRRAIGLMPKLASARVNLGNVLQELGRYDEAVDAYRSAIEVEPGAADIHNSLGLALRELRQFDDAIAAYRQALSIAPTYADAHNNLGVALWELGHVDEAVAAYQRALDLDPKTVQAWINLGNALKDLNEPEKAEAALKRAVEQQPRNPDALGFLAALYEETNRVEDAEVMFGRGLAVEPNHPHCTVVAAACDRRAGRVEEGIGRLEPICRTLPSSRLNNGAYFELGRLYDRLGDDERAYAAFAKANDLARTADEGRKRYLGKIDILSERFTREWLDTWSPAAPAEDRPSPVFLIGFPRSGTTLLEQIIDSHPNLQAVDERPTVMAMNRAVRAMPGGFPDALATLTAADIADLRAAYFEAAGHFIDPAAGGIIVDKMPLNITNAGLIHRVFPDARFILALRHPCDACLSCFMQHFRANDAMANFYSLEDTATLYAKVMDLWRHYLGILPLQYHRIRYEDLVDDMEREVSRLLDFLGVDWNESVLGYAEHARSRGRINTPSYHQVSEPIYRRARYRWLRYADQLEPVMALLQPSIEDFGYAAA